MFPALLPTYNRTNIAFVRGEGSYLFAEDGKRYLDFGAGIAVASTLKTAVLPVATVNAAGCRVMVGASRRAA